MKYAKFYNEELKIMKKVFLMIVLLMGLIAMGQVWAESTGMVSRNT